MLGAMLKLNCAPVNKISISIFYRVYVLTFSIADPDPHSICHLEPDPASECGFGSSYLTIGAKSPEIYYDQRNFRRQLQTNDESPQKKKKKSRCRRGSLLLNHNNGVIPYAGTGILLTVVGQILRS
jgi:hypothetical protein